ncbi:hypothetical protein DFH08DRAFT_1039835 [Mycena albidolilacea]|uniref:Uncharacterized protein n=1 Tax=Mycena albidolilacea TaxID=1033008 RepID=A0AAD7EEC7_9AGAR|nr:hypothetical protein DFH08DRAFT_1039835 [Mycena albidolilacea]
MPWYKFTCSRGTPPALISTLNPALLRPSDHLDFSHHEEVIIRFPRSAQRTYALFRYCSLDHRQTAPFPADCAGFLYYWTPQDKDRPPLGMGLEGTVRLQTKITLAARHSTDRPKEGKRESCVPHSCHCQLLSNECQIDYRRLRVVLGTAPHVLFRALTYRATPTRDGWRRAPPSPSSAAASPRSMAIYEHMLTVCPPYFPTRGREAADRAHAAQNAQIQRVHGTSIPPCSSYVSSYLVSPYRPRSLSSLHRTPHDVCIGADTAMNLPRSHSKLAEPVLVLLGQPVMKRELSPRTSAFVESTSDLLGSNKISIPRLHTPVPVQGTSTYRPDTRTRREPAPVHVQLAGGGHVGSKDTDHERPRQALSHISPCKFLGLASNLRVFPSNEIAKGALTMKLKYVKQVQESITWPQAIGELPIVTWEDFQEELKTRPLLLVI